MCACVVRVFVKWQVVLLFNPKVGQEIRGKSKRDILAKGFKGATTVKVHVVIHLQKPGPLQRWSRVATDAITRVCFTLHPCAENVGWRGELLRTRSRWYWDALLEVRGYVEV